MSSYVFNPWLQDVEREGEIRMNKLIAPNRYFGTCFNGSVEVSVFLAHGGSFHYRL